MPAGWLIILLVPVLGQPGVFGSPECECDDIEPPGGISCEKQVGFWLGGEDLRGPELGIKRGRCESAGD